MEEKKKVLDFLVNKKTSRNYYEGSIQKTVNGVGIIDKKEIQKEKQRER